MQSEQSQPEWMDISLMVTQPSFWLQQAATQEDLALSFVTGESFQAAMQRVESATAFD